MMGSFLLLQAFMLPGWFCGAYMVHAQSLHLSGRALLSHEVAGFGIPVPVERLAAVRGGFDLGNGLEVSFGIERAVYIDGSLVIYTNVNIPDIAHISTQEATSLASALSTVDIQSGSGNTFTPSSMGQISAATVIQNTLSNQIIRNITTLNVSVNTLNAFNEQGLQQSLQAAQVQALQH